VDALRDGFTLFYTHFLDISHDRPDYRKMKRIHFQDPFYFFALKAWAGGGKPYDECLTFLKSSQNQGVLVEDIVAEHIVRLAFALSDQKQMFDSSNSVFYWRSKRDREVDLVLRREKNDYIPIEVKYTSGIKREDKFGLIDFLKASPKSKTGLLLTKDRLEARGGILQIPAWMFLLLV
jgi:hypothetical protein